MSSVVVAMATACGFATAAAVHSWSHLGLIALLFSVVSWRTSDWRSYAGLTLGWTIPVLVPLGLIHGTINPAFPASTAIGPIPIRALGLQYAATVTAKLLLVAVVVVAWRGVRRTQLVALAQALWLPSGVVVVLAATSSAVALVTRRIDAVSIAQQARGLSIGPGPSARLRALFAIAIPVITTTLVEASHRGLVVAARGLGQHTLATVAPLDFCGTAMVRVAILTIATFWAFVQ